MANEIEIKVPDIGGTNQVDVIEILVQVGDEISKDTSLITLESDKASMEIPSPISGKVTKINLKVGDKVAEGDVILHATVETTAENIKTEIKEPSQPQPIEQEVKEQKDDVVAPQSQIVSVDVPDIGGSTDVDVIDILIKVGDEVKKDQSLITLEGDKATMDIPCPFAGVVKSISIKLGDKVSQGSPILSLQVNAGSDIPNTTPKQSSPKTEAEKPAMAEKTNTSNPTTIKPQEESTYTGLISAGPGVRRLAREFGIDLTRIKGTGRKSRITKEDLQSYVKSRLSEKPGAGQFNLPQAAPIDFTKFGEIETKPLNKIKKLTGVNVHRAWLTIPHVTQFDEADITELEAFRKSESEHAQAAGYKLTLLAFVCGVVSRALLTFPQFNASLDVSGENLIYKKYCNIGIAVETPNGLVVPVIKNTDTLTVADIAIEMARLSTKAREKGLMPADMSGGCFTISSLGGIGGTAFTPIVNSPEVAILGLSRSVIRPVYENDELKPKLMLPLSLSYDHRVIDGAEAARFTGFIADSLSDIRRILL